MQRKRESVERMTQASATSVAKKRGVQDGKTWRHAEQYDRTILHCRTMMIIELMGQSAPVGLSLYRELGVGSLRSASPFLTHPGTQEQLQQFEQAVSALRLAALFCARMHAHASF